MVERWISSHRNTWASSAGKSITSALQRLWVWIRLKTPEIFQVHLWDNPWDCPASVRIISSIQQTMIILVQEKHWAEAFKHMVLPFNPTPVFFIDSTTSSSVYLLPYIISLQIKNKTSEEMIPLILILTNVFTQGNDFQQ